MSNGFLRPSVVVTSFDLICFIPLRVQCIPRSARRGGPLAPSGSREEVRGRGASAALCDKRR